MNPIPKNPGTNKSWLQDVVGQSYYELIPIAVRSAIDLIPEEFFRNTVMPMLGVLNIAIPAVAVVIRKMTNLKPEMDDAISEILSEIKRALDEKAKHDGQTAGAAKAKGSDRSTAKNQTIAIGLAVLLLDKKMQVKFFKNLEGVQDEEIRRKLLAFELEVPKDVAAAKFVLFSKKDATIPDELKLRIDLFEKETGLPVAFAVQKVTGLANLSGAAFLVWVEAHIKKDPPKKDILKEIQKKIDVSKTRQEQIIAELRQKKANRLDDAQNREDNARPIFLPFVKFINSLKGN